MSKDVILFVNAVRPATFGALEVYAEKTGRTFTPVVLVDSKIQESITERNGQKQHANGVTVLSADFDSSTSVREVLRPYEERIFAVTSQYENSILELKKLVPYLPYLPMPTEASLEWATEKKLMRELLGAYDSKLVPGYKEIIDMSTSTIQDIEQSLSYPLVVKPSGLEGSLLVSLVNDRKELTQTLKRTFAMMQDAYNVWIKRQTPSLLVEEFMDGDMYSIDTYIGADGSCVHAPVVKVVTGRKIGFDDFFGYMRLTPSGLTESEVTAAKKAAEKACHALGLRSVTAHVELMKLPNGWKIIELGPRIGGYRHDLYFLSYGINHIMNDILNRAGEQPEVSTKTLQYTAVFNIYCREEGMLKSIKGIQAVRDLLSFVSLKQDLTIGQYVRFAKNNGDPVLEITLSHSDPKQLELDIATMQQAISLEVAQARMWHGRRRGFHKL